MRYSNRWIMTLTLALVAGCSSPGEENGDPADFQAYVELARQSGMSESALGSLNSVAGVLAGQYELTMGKNEGSESYWHGFQSNVCGVPGLGAMEQASFRERMQAQRDSLVGLLAPLADADGSGFVTAAEASSFKSLFEFGFRVDYVLTNVGEDLEELCAGCQVAPEEFAGRLREYNRLVQDLLAGGIEGPQAISWSPTDDSSG